jgi:hypothetical protein
MKVSSQLRRAAATTPCLLRCGHQKDKTIYGIGDFAVSCSERLYGFTPDFFDRD